MKTMSMRDPREQASLSVSADGRSLAAAGLWEGGSLDVWTRLSGGTVMESRRRVYGNCTRADSFRTVALTPDGHNAVTGKAGRHSYGVALVRDAKLEDRHAAPWLTLKPHSKESGAGTLAVSPCGSVAVAVSLREPTMLIDVWTLVGSPHSPAGTLIASASAKMPRFQHPVIFFAPDGRSVGVLLGGEGPCAPARRAAVPLPMPLPLPLLATGALIAPGVLPVELSALVARYASGIAYGAA